MSVSIARPLSSLALALALGGCATSRTTDIALEILNTPVIDVSPFQRVLVAGFVVGGTTEIDTNQETVRLLRSQLRSKTSLTVIDRADALPLVDLATARAEEPSVLSDGVETKPNPHKPITREADLRTYEAIFANTAYWKRLGEEYLDLLRPLIVTGTVLFTVDTTHKFNWGTREQIDPFGRHSAAPQSPAVAERTVCALGSKFIFIDGRTGAQVYSEVLREAVSHESQRSVPVLSSYFELMDRMLPALLNTISTQTFQTTRSLLQ